MYIVEIFIIIYFTSNIIKKTGCLVRQPVKISKVSILKAANRSTVSTIVAAHEGKAPIKVQESRVSAIYGTRPVVAAGTNTVERTSAVAAVACYGKFKR